MNQEEKYTKLRELIAEEIPFSVEQGEIISLLLDFETLKALFPSITKSELKKYLVRLVEENFLVGYKPHLDLGLSNIKGGVSHYDGYSLFLPVSKKNNYEFDTNSGDFKKGNSTVNFKPKTKQYLFIKLLDSKPGKLFSMEYILKEVYGEGKSLRGYQKNIYDLADKIKQKLSDSEIKDIIDTSKNGYRINLSKVLS